MELTPRAAEDEAQIGRRSRSRMLLAVMSVILVGVAGFLMMRALSDASVFFKNADEAVAERDDLGERRFRLQGTVVPGTVEPTSDGVMFSVSYNEVEVPVRHLGDPVELFQEGIPVVLEGHWGVEVYESDWMAVKHTEVYESENPDRLDQADEMSDSLDGSSDGDGDGAANGNGGDTEEGLPGNGSDSSADPDESLVDLSP